MTQPSDHSPPQPPLVVLVDDDLAIREGFGSLLRSAGLRVEAFASALELLNSGTIDSASCLILDVRLPGMDGLEFQSKLADMRSILPIVFMTGYGDIPMTVRAMRGGAVDFLAKPVQQKDILQAVSRAVAQGDAARSSRDALLSLRQRYAALTRRERETMWHVTTGAPNKLVASSLGVSEITVKVHRSNVMRKMEAQSLPDLVRMAELLELTEAIHDASPREASAAV